MMTRAVVLAAGRGTRMQREDAGATLDAGQRAMAERGLKGLIPFHGHPYLAYVLSALADAGYREVCLVVAPGENPIREHFQEAATERLRLHFQVQQEPLGSAHAVLAAEPFAGTDPFLVINADNFYPPEVVAPLRELHGSGMAGFRRYTLTARSNIPAERIAAYALVTTDPDGVLTGIVEKPTPEVALRLADHAWISMTCWRFEASIFEACRAVRPSSRGELELPDAVALAAAEMGERFQVVPVEEGVLDLSSRADVASVERWLRGRVVRL